jgi:hypothetical protein
LHTPASSKWQCSWRDFDVVKVGVAGQVLERALNLTWAVLPAGFCATLQAAANSSGSAVRMILVFCEQAMKGVLSRALYLAWAVLPAGSCATLQAAANSSGSAVRVILMICEQAMKGVLDQALYLAWDVLPADPCTFLQAAQNKQQQQQQHQVQMSRKHDQLQKVQRRMRQQ